MWTLVRPQGPVQTSIVGTFTCWKSTHAPTENAGGPENEGGIPLLHPPARVWQTMAQAIPALTEQPLRAERSLLGVR